MKSKSVVLISFFIIFVLSLFFLKLDLKTTVFGYDIDNRVLFEKMFQKTDSFGYLHLMGQIKNNLNMPLENVTVESTFFDQDNKILGQYERKAELGVIDSNKTSPFEIIYLDTTTAQNIKNYTLSVKHYDVGTSKEKLLSIETVSSRPDISGFFYINGKIKNNGDKHATNAMIIATFYNNEGNVIGVSKAIVEPINIAKGRDGGFGLVFVEKELSFKIKNFALNAFSDQYVSEPFFK